MIFDLRIYTFKPGTQGAWLDMYEQRARAIQERHLGKAVLCAVTEVGPLNQAIHVWAYTDYADFEGKRRAMLADPEWQEYLRLSAEANHTQAQENRLLRSAPFSSL